MATPVFFTVDTEFAWRHHAAGLDVEMHLAWRRGSRHPVANSLRELIETSFRPA